MVLELDVLKPGDIVLYKRGSVEIWMNFLCLENGHLWFSNGMHFLVDSPDLHREGNNEDTFCVSGGLYPTFFRANLVGNLNECKRGDVVLIFNDHKNAVSTDVILVKDSDRKLLVTVKGRILPFVDLDALPSGIRLSEDEIDVPLDTNQLLHQMYD